MLCCGYTLTDLSISIRLTSLALWQSNDCPSASKATLMNMDKYFTWIHYERLHNHNKAKQNKTVCIFLGIYCMSSLIYCGICVHRFFIEQSSLCTMYMYERSYYTDNSKYISLYTGAEIVFCRINNGCLDVGKCAVNITITTLWLMLIDIYIDFHRMHQNCIASNKNTNIRCLDLRLTTPVTPELQRINTNGSKCCCYFVLTLNIIDYSEEYSTYW